MYTVTRQVQHPTGLRIVEVSLGGLDYANPDMLVTQFAGEGESYSDPIEAAAAAIEVCRQWRKQGSKSASVGYGATGGQTIPFEPCTFKELQKWAKDRHDGLVERLPTCDECGEIIWETSDRFRAGHTDEDQYCSRICEENAYEATACPDYE